jgi:hypothetical protein
VGPNCTSYWVDCPVFETDLTGIWKSPEICEGETTITTQSSFRKRAEQHACNDRSLSDTRACTRNKKHLRECGWGWEARQQGERNRHMERWRVVCADC